MKNINVLVVIDLDSFKHQVSKLLKSINAPENLTYFSYKRNDVIKFNIRMIRTDVYNKLLETSKSKQVDLLDFDTIFASSIEEAIVKFKKHFDYKYGTLLYNITPTGNIQEIYQYDWHKPNFNIVSNSFENAKEIAIEIMDKLIKNRHKTILECEQIIKETELRKQSLLST